MTRDIPIVVVFPDTVVERHAEFGGDPSGYGKGILKKLGTGN